MLDDKHKQSMVVTYRLTPAMARVFELLLEVPLATNQMIEACVNGGKTPARLVIYRLRSQLGLTTIRIHRRNRAGYWLDTATKAHIMRTITDNLKHLKVKNDNADARDRETV